MIKKEVSPLEKILDAINYSSDNLFLTGKAGTGKTTFLKHLSENCNKRFIVTAPTGVSAINLGGVTLHSFFKLPLQPYVPKVGLTGQFLDALSAYNIRGERLEVIQKLELLVIDEVSMVRADVLDAVSDVLCHYRKNPKPFGGVQVLLVGDLLQLPPVYKKEDEEILVGTYSSMFFFASKALKLSGIRMIEFEKVYRQKDPVFTGFLNEIRQGYISSMGEALLSKMLLSKFDNEDIITLCSHRAMARNINDSKLDSIMSSVNEYNATLSGEFSLNALPCESTLLLKIGARVLFTVNDTDGNRYYNGSIGTVLHLDKTSVTVRLDMSGEDIVVYPYVWRNMTFVVNPDTGNIEGKEVGTCKQFPLALAWAITIHKCQGLTFDRISVDAAKSFAPGQVYVALSRCRTSDGIRLVSPITKKQLFVNREIESFYSQLRCS